MYFIGYFGASFLLIWGISCLVTRKKVRYIPQEEQKIYKRKRLLISLVFGILLGIILQTISFIAENMSSAQ